MSPGDDAHPPNAPRPEPDKIITAGKAQVAIALALARVKHTILQLEEVATAGARQLDATAQGGPTSP